MFVSFYTSALEPDEMITWISVPAIRPDEGWGFVEYAHQHGDYGLAGAGTVLTLRPDGRIASLRAAALSIADRPLLFVGDDAVGRLPDDRLFDDLSHAWTQHVEPVADDADYARRLCAMALAESMATAARRAVAAGGESHLVH
jgi:carbon-monoxide dehydrogenase medium subunit